MAAILVWGKGFKLEHTVLPSGDGYVEVSGVDGGSESITWSSVQAMVEVAEQHGVGRATWPLYPDCDVEAEVPLEEARMRSDQLRSAFDGIPAEVIDNDYWLNAVAGLLRKGHSFFVMT